MTSGLLLDILLTFRLVFCFFFPRNFTFCIGSSLSTGVMPSSSLCPLEQRIRRFSHNASFPSVMTYLRNQCGVSYQVSKTTLLEQLWPWSVPNVSQVRFTSFLRELLRLPFCEWGMWAQEARRWEAVWSPRGQQGLGKRPRPRPETLKGILLETHTTWDRGLEALPTADETVPPAAHSQPWWWWWWGGGSSDLSNPGFHLYACITFTSQNFFPQVFRRTSIFFALVSGVSRILKWINFP